MAEETENVDTSPKASSREASALPEPASGLSNTSTFTPDERDEDLFDADSAYGAYSDITDTVSLNSQILRFREENGRTYHSYGSTEHWGSVDEDALYQQDISHHFWTLMINQNLYLAPVKNPQRILDLGCGTGIWVIDVAEKHPEADVKGIDLAPIQPAWVPPNARFEMDDFNLDQWDIDNKYDLIHERELLGSIRDLTKFYEQCFRALKPGGWIDCTEPHINFESEYFQLDENHPFTQWGKIMLESGEASGMPFHIAPFVKQRLEEAGFINVVEKVIRCAIGPWPKDPVQKELGQWEQLRLREGVQIFCERRCINNLGWNIDEVTIYGARIRAAIMNNRLRAHHDHYFIIGQKPPVDEPME